MSNLLVGSLIVFCSAIVYAAFFWLNSFLFQSLVFSSGVSWIFLPAGLRLVLTLIFGAKGAIGISITSVLIGIFFYFSDPVIAIGAGILGGLSPYIARLTVFKDLNLLKNLSNLDGSKLLNCIFIYSLISPVLHQAWFTFTIPNNYFWDNLGVMIIGDLVGTLIIVYLSKSLIFISKKFSKPL
jgi:hypothetical protein